MFSKSTVKYIQSLQHKKFRDEHNVFIAEGPKIVDELLKAGNFLCKSVYAVQEWKDSQPGPILSLLENKLEIIKDFELEKIAAYATPNKVVAVFEKRLMNEDPVIKNKLTLVLDDVRNPGNLGTIIRTADWFGIENIICSKNTVEMYNSKVVQSTMASLGRSNIIYADLLAWLQKHPNVRKLATSLNGISIKKTGALKEAIIIIGNESNGIRPEILEFADEKITIPKKGSAESLNAAVAAGIILYEVSGGRFEL